MREDTVSDSPERETKRAPGIFGGLLHEAVMAISRAENCRDHDRDQVVFFAIAVDTSSVTDAHRP